MASRNMTNAGSRSGFSVPLLMRTRLLFAVARDEQAVRITTSTTAGTMRFLSAVPAAAKQQQQNHLLEWRIQNFLQQHQTERQTRDLGKSMQVLQVCSGSLLLFVFYLHKATVLELIRCFTFFCSPSSPTKNSTHHQNNNRIN